MMSNELARSIPRGQPESITPKVEQIKKKLDGGKAMSREKQEKMKATLEEVVLRSFLNSLAFIVLRSEPGTKKFVSFLQVLEEMKVLDGTQVVEILSVQHQKEKPTEEAYHKLEALHARPALIAAMKADESRTFSELEDETDRVLMLDLIQEELGQGSVKLKNELASFGLYRGHDVMTTLGEGDERQALFKPSADIAMLPDSVSKKLLLMMHTKALFGSDNSGKSHLHLQSIVAEALYEPRTNLGVVHERMTEIEMKTPNDAFWYCYFLGTKDPDMPASYMATAERFNTIYAEMKKKKDLDSLRGWTPQSGAKGAEKVNGGFQADCIFARRLLYTRITKNTQPIEKENPSFSREAELVARLWRGEPVLFPEALQDLADLIRRKASGIPMPENHLAPDFDKARQEVRRHFSSDLEDPDRLLGGDWYAFTGSRETNVQDKMKKQFDASIYFLNELSHGKRVH